MTKINDKYSPIINNIHDISKECFGVEFSAESGITPLVIMRKSVCYILVKIYNVPALQIHVQLGKGRIKHCTIGYYLNCVKEWEKDVRQWSMECGYMVKLLKMMQGNGQNKALNTDYHDLLIKYFIEKYTII